MSENFDVGIQATLKGVHVYARKDGKVIPLGRLEPEFARIIAESLTLRSFEVEDMRREKSSGG